MKKNKRHRFSIVELICIIVIVGLIITMSIFTVLRTLEKTEENSRLAQEELIIRACERYITKHLDAAPKAIGDSTNIEFDKLKSSNYLTEDIYDTNKSKDKETKEKYVEDIPNPDVNLLFIDGKEENNNNLIFNNINESRIYIDMNGGEDSFGRKIELYNYEIVIYMRTKTNPNLKQVYSSGVIDANRRYADVIDKKIMSYVNAKDATEIKVVVRTMNVLGGVSEVTSIAQANNNGN